MVKRELAEETILATLTELAGRYKKIVAWVIQAHLPICMDERTVRRYLVRLEEQGRICRPFGPRMGYQDLTTRARALAAQYQMAA